jgi:NADH:ubiquinone oxidoreductase subunit C
MNFEALVESLKTALDDAVIEVVSPATGHESCGDPVIIVNPSRILDVMAYLRDSKDSNLDFLSLISGVDYPKDGIMEVVYHLDSIRRNTPPRRSGMSGRFTTCLEFTLRVILI